jgi:glycolate oxidase
MYAQPNSSDIRFFISILGQDRVRSDADSLTAAASDMTEDFVFLPSVVVFPDSTLQVSQLMAHCHERHIPVTVRGAGTGLSGGALPVHGGIVLSTARMNAHPTVDTQNMQVHVQPGVITQVLQECVEEHGLFYPPDPSSRGSSFIGGNLAESSGGPRAVKYGVTKDYVLNLEVVLADGRIMETGANVLKNATGYNLTQLMVGSEGTLAVITRITLRLIPLPTLRWTFLLPFPDAQKAVSAVPQIFSSGISPSALEFMEKEAIAYTLSNRPDLSFPAQNLSEAYLLIELDGFDEDELQRQTDRLLPVLEAYEPEDVWMATTAAETEGLWKVRRSIGEAVKSHSIYKEEDTVVPRYHLPELLQFVKQLGAEYGFQSVCYGHAGDGNLHVNILRSNLTEQQWQDDLPIAIRKLFIKVKELGGTLSGEHGIGWVQKPYMDVVCSPAQLEMMKGIKAVFDSRGILNPGKIFPD